MLNRPPLGADSLVYAIPNSVQDTDTKYGANKQTPSNLAPGVQHKWYTVYDIGNETRTGSNQATYSSPLTAGNLQRIHTDSVPEYWLISVISCNQPSAQLLIWTDSDPVGPPVRVANGGSATLPSKGSPYICVRAQGVNVAGNIVAIGGYHTQELHIYGGTQP